MEDNKKNTEIDFAEEIKGLCKSANDISTNCLLQTNSIKSKISGIEKDVDRLTESDKNIIRDQLDLRKSIEEISKAQSKGDVVVISIKDTMLKFIEDHEGDAAEATKAMKGLAKTIITCILLLSGFVGGFMAWQTHHIIKSQSDYNTLMMENIKDENKK